MTQRTVLRAVPALIALAAFTFNVSAQGTNPTGPGPAAATTNKAGEAYPNDPNAANPNKPKMEVVKKAENSTPVKATKRTARKAKNAVKRTGTKAANAMRKAGNKVSETVTPNSPKPAP